MQILNSHYLQYRYPVFVYSTLRYVRFQCNHLVLAPSSSERHPMQCVRFCREGSRLHDYRNGNIQTLGAALFSYNRRQRLEVCTVTLSQGGNCSLVSAIVIKIVVKLRPYIHFSLLLYHSLAWWSDNLYKG